MRWSERRIGPYSEEEINEFDALEEELIDRQVPFGQMMRMYAEFLCTRIVAGRFDKIISSEYLSFIANHLQTAIASFEARNSDELRRPGKHELWTLSDRSESENLARAALSRCAVCCFHQDTRWDQDENESPTPLPLYIFFASGLLPIWEWSF